ncbi:MAG: DEAD/DEAH box helicase [bacterium]
MSHPVDVEDDTRFADLGLREELLAVLDSLGYEEPTPIQRQAIPPVLAGRDLLGQAATGTGKTAAFALPILQRLPAGPRSLSALVLVPTRELAIQVSQAVHRYGRDLGARVLPVYGGSPIGRQIRELERGVDVVVATPGRALDHLGRGTLSLDSVRLVVLDEADEMLDMGFAEDIESILQAAPTDRQTVLFSATMPARLDAIARRHLHDPVTLRIARPAPGRGEAPSVRQVAYLVPRASKASALGRLLDIEAPVAAIVFCRTREEVDSLTETLTGRGYRAEALHGGMTQDQRDRVMNRLRSGAAELLVATDVAARGLDIEQLSHVVNYDVPSAPEAYIHRIGRVGRAGREGVAITLVEPRQHRLLKTIEKAARASIAVEKVPTVADLQARRLELTRSALYETLVDAGAGTDDSGSADGSVALDRVDDSAESGAASLDRFRVIVETLADDFDLMEIALAAVKLASDAAGPDQPDDDIPDVAPVRSRDDDRSRAAAATVKLAGRGDTAKVFIGLGRVAKIRPQDVVGAIANETSLSGRQIGAIEIAERFSTVEVPAAAADEVISALRATKIKGRTVKAELYRPRPR